VHRIAKRPAIARQLGGPFVAREKPQQDNWRRERDSNPHYGSS
jgi:hypothetical protein